MPTVKKMLNQYYGCSIISEKTIPLRGPLEEKFHMTMIIGMKSKSESACIDPMNHVQCLVMTNTIICTE